MAAYWKEPKLALLKLRSLTKAVSANLDLVLVSSNCQCFLSSVRVEYPLYAVEQLGLSAYLGMVLPSHAGIHNFESLRIFRWIN